SVCVSPALSQSLNVSLSVSLSLSPSPSLALSLLLSLSLSPFLVQFPSFIMALSSLVHHGGSGSKGLASIYGWAFTHRHPHTHTHTHTHTHRRACPEVNTTNTDTLRNTQMLAHTKKNYTQDGAPSTCLCSLYSVSLRRRIRRSSQTPS